MTNIENQPARARARRRIIRSLALLAAVASLLLTLQPAAQALTYTDTYYNSSMQAPNFYFDRNWSNPLDSDMTAYISLLGEGQRRRIAMRAGSGNGSTNDCLTNQGWLPDGTYGRGDNDPYSTFSFFWKDYGSTVVRGWVWYVGDKWCGSKYRTELFIHSQGYSGWQPSNYSSEGCIKIDQDDRAHLANRYNTAYSKSNGRLTVYG